VKQIQQYLAYQLMEIQQQQTMLHSAVQHPHCQLAQAHLLSLLLMALQGWQKLLLLLLLGRVYPRAG
jgi:hypothetical protein